MIVNLRITGTLLLVSTLIVLFFGTGKRGFECLVVAGLGCVLIGLAEILAALRAAMNENTKGT